MADVWPPENLAPVHERMQEWSAWFSGDADELSTVYGGISAVTNAPTAQSFFRRPARRGSGLLGRLARFFWGDPARPGERRSHKEHLPLASAITAVSANLLFGEMPSFEAEDEATQARLDEFVDDGFHAALREGAEVAAALGGVYLRVVWDAEVRDHPWISVVHPDCAVPEWRWDKLAAVTFWHTIRDDGFEIVRQLERHEPGVIRHSVWKGTADSLGRPMALTDFPETAPLADLVDSEGGISTGIEKLTAVYVPNIKPNRIWRNTPAGMHLGRSDFSGIESTLDNLDEAYTDWMRDVRLGKARLLLDTSVLESMGRGNGAAFDTDQELFVPLNIGTTEDGTSPIEQVQFEIRTEAHQILVQELVERCIQGSGYSVQSFGLTGDVAVTATEVQARKEQSLNTRSNKITYWRPALAEIIEVQLEVDKVHFGTSVVPQQPKVEFPDAVARDPKSVAEELNLLTSARAISTEQKVRRLNPDWDDQQVAHEVLRIREDAEAETPPDGHTQALIRQGDGPTRQGRTPHGDPR
ncbi:phage portal protein [Streptomyces sp. CO7]